MKSRIKKLYFSLQSSKVRKNSPIGSREVAGSNPARFENFCPSRKRPGMASQSWVELGITPGSDKMKFRDVSRKGKNFRLEPDSNPRPLSSQSGCFCVLWSSVTKNIVFLFLISLSYPINSEVLFHIPVSYCLAGQRTEK